MFLNPGLPGRSACLAALLLVSGCTYDIFNDVDDYDRGRLDLDEVLGTYAGERTLAAPGQSARAAAVATVSRVEGAVVQVRIEADGRVDEYLGIYDGFGLSFNGEVAGGAGSFNWYVDGDGFITGDSFIGATGDSRRYTGRLVRDAFDLLIRSPDGQVRDDLRTTR